MKDLNFQPHILVITEPEPGLKEWEVEHPDSCPVACSWTPFTSDYWNGKATVILGTETDVEGGDPGCRTCYVQYELESIGLDVCSLAGFAHLDPDWMPASQFEADWKRLRPGRYLIEGWYESGAGMGEYGGWGDPDGGLKILTILPSPVAVA